MKSHDVFRILSHTSLFGWNVTMNKFIYEEDISACTGATVMKFYNKAIKVIVTPAQRVGLVIICTGFTMFTIGLIYDIAIDYPRSFSRFFGNLFSDFHRNYNFHLKIAWYGLIIFPIGIWLAWIHEWTTARLLKWIKTGKFDNLIVDTTTMSNSESTTQPTLQGRLIAAALVAKFTRDELEKELTDEEVGLILDVPQDQWPKELESKVESLLNY